MSDNEARTYLLAEVARDIMTISGQEKEASVNPAALKIILPGVLGWTSGHPLALLSSRFYLLLKLLLRVWELVIEHEN